MSGSGDIAPAVAGSGKPGRAVEHSLVGAFAGLIALVVVAAMFITAEYRRGLIRTTLAASPRRGRVLAAKALVIGTVAFGVGLAGAAAAVLLGERLLRGNGNFVYPVTPLTEIRVVVGTAALLAVAAVLALGIGAILRSSAAAVAAVIALTAALSAAAAAAVTCPSAGCGQDPAKISLTGIELGQAVVAVLAVLAISGEYGTGMIRTTLAAMPRRTTVLAAKAAILTGLVLAAGTIAVLASVLTGRLILPCHGFTPVHGFPPLSLGDGPMLRAAAGSVLYLGLIALLSLGTATAVRDSAAAIGAVLGLLYLFPITAAAITDPHWQRHLEQIGPMSAGLAIQATIGLRSLPLSPWAGLGVLAAWAAAALLAGGLLLQLRDA